VSALIPQLSSFKCGLFCASRQVVVLQLNGIDQPKELVHALNVGRLRMRLMKGKSVVAKEFYSSSMQVWHNELVIPYLLFRGSDCTTRNRHVPRPKTGEHMFMTEEHMNASILAQNDMSAFKICCKGF
jgi:hypothetical protein